ncbi:MAG: chemotaxis protein CheX [Planctomycetaceae bacterium]|nr:chemotaxis protein CheX [Planctomycetaceae bacterium]
MSAVAEPSVLQSVSVRPELLDAVQKSVSNAMVMCGLKVRCTGVSSVPTQQTGIVTGMIGVHGKVTGFATVNMAERFAVRAVEGLLGDEHGKLTSMVVDGAGEITNIIVGGIKSSLAKTEFGFSHITVPSVLVGQNVTIAYARGLNFATVSFELDDPEAVRLEERMMHVSLSLLTL